VTSIKTSNMSHSTHILVYPFAPSGHFIPLLDLTRLLLRRGLTITIIVSANNLALLDPLVSSHPSSLYKLLLPDPDHGQLPHPLIAKVIATQQMFEPIVQWFESHPSPPIAIISDFFLRWTNGLASHLGIRHVVFSPSGALGYSIFHMLWRDIYEINALHDEGDQSYMLSFPEIPNSPELPWWQLSQTWRSYNKGDPGFESFRKGVLDNMKSWGIVYNTVWAVGPLLPDDHGPMSSTSRGGSSAVPPHDLFMWLDEKHDDSVVYIYICFGSRETLSEEEMTALTDALKLSKVYFLLCVHESGSSLIPSGFEQHVGGRGFIVKGWAPQLEILQHRAVGSFVTHCGWNSTLESVTSGVMMLTWPMGADQFANAVLLVDQLGVGKRVCDGEPECVPNSVELARLLDESLNVDRPERLRVKELSREAIMAIKEGTSLTNLNMFVKLLYEL
ncbi:hypothetical protein M8C21_009738, partial [Ambrosia artemisiifolia]